MPADVEYHLQHCLLHERTFPLAMSEDVSTSPLTLSKDMR